MMENQEEQYEKLCEKWKEDEAADELADMQRNDPDYHDEGRQMKGHIQQRVAPQIRCRPRRKDGQAENANSTRFEAPSGKRKSSWPN